MTHKLSLDRFGADFGRKHFVDGPQICAKLPGPKARAVWDRFLVRPRYICGHNRPQTGSRIICWGHLRDGGGLIADARKVNSLSAMRDEMSANHGTQDRADTLYMVSSHSSCDVARQCYSMLRNGASGPLIGLLGRIWAGLLHGKH